MRLAVFEEQAAWKGRRPESPLEWLLVDWMVFELERVEIECVGECCRLAILSHTDASVKLSHGSTSVLSKSPLFLFAAVQERQGKTDERCGGSQRAQAPTAALDQARRPLVL